LFNQYKSDSTTFKDLMVNLSNSMYDILKDSANKGLTELDDGTLVALAAKFAGTDAKSADVGNVFGFAPGAGDESAQYQLTARQVTDTEAGILQQGSTELQTAKSADVGNVFEFAPGAGDESAQYQLTARQVTNPEAAILQQGSPARESATTSGEGAKMSLTVGYGDTQDPDKQPILASPAAGTTLYTTDSQNIGYVSKKRGRSSIESTAVTDVKAIGSVSSAVSTPLEAKQLDLTYDLDSDTEGGSRINKRHSKNRTKRVSYIKHKQTRKNQHSRKTK
jgi:hypothetical protein